MTLEEQLNCVCDGLAKAAVNRSMTGKMGCKIIHLLPHEKAAIIVNGSKLTTEADKEVCYCLGERDAWDFYTAPHKPKG